MVLSIRMNLAKGSDRMTAEQAARIVRLTQTFDNGHVALDEEGELDAILDAIERVADVVDQMRRPPETPHVEMNSPRH